MNDPLFTLRCGLPRVQSVAWPDSCSMARVA
jgi:hypothetical protein